jgi:hypothetical protein
VAEMTHDIVHSSGPLIIEGGDPAGRQALLYLAHKAGMQVRALVDIEVVGPPSTNGDNLGGVGCIGQLGRAGLELARAERPHVNGDAKKGEPQDPELLVTATKEDFLAWYDTRIDHSGEVRVTRARLGAGSKSWTFLSRAIRDGFSVPRLSSPPLPEFKRAVFQTAEEPTSKAKGPGSRISESKAAKTLDVERSNNLDLVGLARYIVDVTARLEQVEREGYTLDGSYSRTRKKEFMPYGVSMRGLALFGQYGQHRYDTVRDQLDTLAKEKLDKLFRQDLAAASQKLLKFHLGLGGNQARQARPFIAV